MKCKLGKAFRIIQGGKPVWSGLFRVCGCEFYSLDSRHSVDCTIGILDLHSLLFCLYFCVSLTLFSFTCTPWLVMLFPVVQVGRAAAIFRMRSCFGGKPCKCSRLHLCLSFLLTHSCTVTHTLNTDMQLLRSLPVFFVFSLSSSSQNSWVL